MVSGEPGEARLLMGPFMFRGSKINIQCKDLPKTVNIQTLF